MIAIVAVYGIAWMAETMFGAHMTEIKGVLGEMVKEYPWAYAIVLLLVSKFVNSQAAALAAIVPVALAIGVDPAYIVASAPACYGYYILPTYPSDLAAIQFDRSGTTHIGRFVINHSFILPGLIGVGVSCVFGWVFAAMYGFFERGRAPAAAPVKSARLLRERQTTIEFNHIGRQILNDHGVHQVVLRVNGDQVDRQLTGAFIQADELGLDLCACLTNSWDSAMACSAAAKSPFRANWRAVSAALRAEPALTNSSMMIVSKSSIDYSSIFRALSRTASPFIMP